MFASQEVTKKYYIMYTPWDLLINFNNLIITYNKLEMDKLPHH